MFERRVGQRIRVINEFGFPAGVRQRFWQHHAHLDTDAVALVEAGARQWFRVIAGNPGAKLAMASTVVDDLWHEFVLHTRDYAQFCDQAFGRFLHHEPEAAMTPAAASRNRSSGLLRTLRVARQDEHCDDTQLPLLFRVDAALDVPGGRRYLLDCGGGDVRCFPAAGVTCLRHLNGVRAKKSPWGSPPQARPRQEQHGRSNLREGFDGGCGGGCGS